MNILLILLGCNISYLLSNRIDTAINFVGKFNETNVDWFLSGGIKNPHEDTITEAEKMAHQISKFEKIHTHELRGNDWNYVYDTIATNTAENFINRKIRDYDEIYVITSEFHHNRANKIAEKLLHVEPKWILGNAKLDDSIYWEKIHIRNVDNDVQKALNKFPIL
jgi:vancomycin permeability regulator SanA